MQFRTGVICLAATMFACAVSALAQTAPPDSPEAKLVEETYGKAIKDAKGTPSEADDLAIGRQMITSSGDKTSSVKLRATLALKALELLLPLGSDDAFAAARDAMGIVQSIEPLTAAQRVKYLRDLHDSHLARARLDRKTKDELLPLAREAGDAHLDYAQVMMSDDSAAVEVNDSLTKARSLMSSFMLTEMKLTLEGLEKDAKGATARRNRINALLPKIEEARAAKDANALATLYKQAVDICLECDGSVTAAAVFAQDSDTRAAAIKAAAAFLKDPASLDAAKAADYIKMLSDLSDKLPDTGKANLSETALQMASAYMAKATPGIAADRVKLLIPHLEANSGQTPLERLRRQIAKTYGSLQGKLEIVDKETVRLTYDFRTLSQFRDWTVQSGSWGFSQEALLCRTQPYSDGRIKCNFFFRFDKPWKVTFTTAGRYEANTNILVFPWQYSRAYEFWYARFDLTYRGASFYSMFYYDDYWSDGAYKLAQGNNYKTEIACDGNGTITWTVNGKILRKVGHPYTDQDNYRKGSFQLRLATRGSDRVPTWFDNVVIQGTILPSPNWVPPGAKSARPVEQDDATGATSKPASGGPGKPRPASGPSNDPNY